MKQKSLLEEGDSSACGNPHKNVVVIEYRSFRNSDPPQLVRLWHSCELGRGAALGFTTDALDLLIFSQPYFDPRGLIVACENDAVVGFIHAGFGCNADETALFHEVGVICMVMVHPNVRRRGIGRSLMQRAERYLIERGARQVFAGPAPRRDPFYFGLYGGSRPAGFLESDPLAAPFFQAVGYEPCERFLVFQRDLNQPSPPMSFRWITIRRKTQLVMTDQPQQPTWWWRTCPGRMDCLHCQLVPKTGGAAWATVTVHGLDFYLHAWQQRAIGITDLSVIESARRQGYGQALLLEVGRRMQEELITCMEAHAPEDNPAAIAVLESAGFRQLETGIVYRRFASA